MPSVFTIQGPERRDFDDKLCRRVRTGKRKHCTMVQCRKELGRGRWQFKKGTMRCS